MPIIPERNLTRSLEREVLGSLLSAISKINNVDDLNNFLARLMSPGEKMIFLRRLAVMKLLTDKKKYRDIRKELRISGATISKVRDILSNRNYSQNPDRKRKYSSFSRKSSGENVLPARYKRRLRYKGTSGVLDPFQFLI